MRSNFNVANRYSMRNNIVAIKKLHDILFRSEENSHGSNYLYHICRGLFI